MTTDFASMVDAYRKAVEAMILTPNEARDALDYNRSPDGDAFRNPNTTSGTTEQPASETTAIAKHETAAVRAHIEHIIGVEKSRLLQFADSPKNFIPQMDKFYTKFSKTLQNGIDKFAAIPTLSSEWCESSKAALLSVCDTCTADELKASVDAELSGWGPRIDKLITEITNG